MIDKLLLNNQIITNKKKIQQARIQIMNKLVQKIRKLKLLNEKKPQNAKIQKNIEKIPKIMQCLKKLKIVDIIRKILTFSKKPTAVLTNGQAPLDDVAIALLACNKILAGIVKTLRTLLSLDDTNPGWQNEILELSRRKKKIIESSERKKNKKLKNDKKQPKILVKKLPWKEEILKSSESDQMENNVDTPPAKGWKEETMNNNTIAELSLQKQIVKNKPKKNDKTQKLVLPSEELYEPEKLTNDKPVTIVDSFFFTQTGDNYLSTVVIDRVQPEPLQDGLIRRERRDNTIRPNKRNNIFRRESVTKAGAFDSKRHSVQSGKIEKRQSFGLKSNDKSQQAVAADEKLHPSWAAKQKQKPVINEFKGQKITFDNDGNDTTVKSSNRLNKQASHQVKDLSTDPSQENIHPSWAAKQRQKPAITQFKGTKITFDD